MFHGKPRVTTVAPGTRARRPPGPSGDGASGADVVSRETTSTPTADGLKPSGDVSRETRCGWGCFTRNTLRRPVRVRAGRTRRRREPRQHSAGTRRRRRRRRDGGWRARRRNAECRDVGPFGRQHRSRRADPGTVGSSGEPEQTDGFEGLAPVPGARFAELPVLSIRPNPRQPRTVFDDDDMAELAHSIREIGVLQPVVVRPIPADELDQVDVVDSTGERPRFELIMGERRWRATQEAGLDTIPAIIKETHDDDLLRDALLENLHRSQLNALEEAAAYQQLLDDFGCTHDQLATRIGRSRPQISNTLRLLKLPPLVQRRVAAGVLSAGHARALLGLADGASMERLAQRIVAEGLSVRTVEEIVTLGSNDAPRPARRPARRRASSAAGRPGRPSVGPLRHPREHRPGTAQGQADGGVRLGGRPQPDRRPARCGRGVTSARAEPPSSTASPAPLGAGDVLCRIRTRVARRGRGSGRVPRGRRRPPRHPDRPPRSPTAPARSRSCPVRCCPRGTRGARRRR